MSRVHYKNENIRKAMSLLADLEQTIGYNKRCAYPGDYRETDDYHQGAMSALVQILEHFPKVRRLLDEVEAEVLKCFLATRAPAMVLGRAMARAKPRERGNGVGQEQSQL